MDYKSFINEIPEETKKIILKAMDIYSVLDKKNLYNFRFRSKNLKKEDKKCVSLFLAGTLINYDIKNAIFEPYPDIIIDEILYFIDINEDDIKTLNEELYNDYFNNDFSLLLSEIIKNYNKYNISVSINNLFPEIIIKGSMKNFKCNPNIVNQNIIHKILGTIPFLINEFLNDSLNKKINNILEVKHQQNENFSVGSTPLNDKKLSTDKMAKIIELKNYINKKQSSDTPITKEKNYPKRNFKTKIIQFPNKNIHNKHI